jgi:hypothetical protein
MVIIYENKSAVVYERYAVRIQTYVSILLDPKWSRPDGVFDVCAHETLQ